MKETDVFPVTVRGPLKTTSSKLVTFARLFTRDGTLYIAESRNKGRTVSSVTAYPLPTTELKRRGSRAARWGDWSWSGCGCSSAWRRWKLDELVAMAEPLEPAPEPEDEDEEESPGAPEVTDGTP